MGIIDTGKEKTIKICCATLLNQKTLQLQIIQIVAGLMFLVHPARFELTTSGLGNFKRISITYYFENS